MASGIRRAPCASWASRSGWRRSAPCSTRGRRAGDRGRCPAWAERGPAPADSARSPRVLSASARPGATPALREIAIASFAAGYQSLFLASLCFTAAATLLTWRLVAAVDTRRAEPAPRWSRPESLVYRRSRRSMAPDGGCPTRGGDLRCDPRPSAALRVLRPRPPARQRGGLHLHLRVPFCHDCTTRRAGWPLPELPRQPDPQADPPGRGARSAAWGNIRPRRSGS